MIRRHASQLSLGKSAFIWKRKTERKQVGHFVLAECDVY